MNPRAHHFQMKYFVAKLALQNPVRFFDTFGPDGDKDYFTDLWKAFGGQLEPAEKVPHDGASVWTSPAGPAGHEVIVLTFPVPEARGEAHFVGAVRLSESGCRVFCLERAEGESPRQPDTVLSELAPHGRANWGTGPAPVREDFVARVRSIVSNPAASPLSFVPLQLA